MTTYQEFMLSICFGVSMGYVFFGIGIVISELIQFVKRKVKAHKEKQNQLLADDRERNGGNQ